MRIPLTRFPVACGIVSRYSSSSFSFSFSSSLMSSIKMFNHYFPFRPNDQVVSWKFGNNYVYPTKQVSLFILMSLRFIEISKPKACQFNIDFEGRRSDNLVRCCKNLVLRSWPPMENIWALWTKINNDRLSLFKNFCCNYKYNYNSGTLSWTYWWCPTGSCTLPLWTTVTPTIHTSVSSSTGPQWSW